MSTIRGNFVLSAPVLSEHLFVEQCLKLLLASHQLIWNGLDNRADCFSEGITRAIYASVLVPFFMLVFGTLLHVVCPALM
jgi:hypothetical protein